MAGGRPGNPHRVAKVVPSATRPQQRLYRVRIVSDLRPPTDPTTILCGPRERRRWSTPAVTADPKRPGAAVDKNPTQSSASTDLVHTCCSWGPKCNPTDVVAVHRTLFAHTHTHTHGRNNNIKSRSTHTHSHTRVHAHGRNAADAFAAKTFVFRRTDDSRTVRTRRRSPTLRISVRGHDEDDGLSQVRGFIIVLNRETLRDYGTITRAAICNAHHWPSQCGQRFGALNIPVTSVCYSRADRSVACTKNPEYSRIPPSGRCWVGASSSLGHFGKNEWMFGSSPPPDLVTIIDLWTDKLWSHCRIDSSLNYKICRLCRFRSPRQKHRTIMLIVNKLL